MAMLIVTHDEQLAQAADSILHMEDGLWVKRFLKNVIKSHC